MTDAEKRAVAEYLGTRRRVAGRGADDRREPADGWRLRLDTAVRSVQRPAVERVGRRRRPITRFQPARAGRSDRRPGAEAEAQMGVRLPECELSARASDDCRAAAVFVGSMSGTVYALDAKTGCTIWTFKAQSRRARTAMVIGPRAGSPGKYVAYFGDGRANAYALDAATGEQIWTRSLEDHQERQHHRHADAVRGSAVRPRRLD